ncbi:MAG: hypothetical protein U0353_28385 [Sandaracinus sp.]
MRGVLRPVVVLVVWLASCAPPDPPGGSYYEERIEPMFGGCLQSAGVCHVGTDRGEAPGNLDLSSYDALLRRADVLERYGPYPVPSLLLKVGEPVSVDVETLDPPDPSQPDVRSVRVRVNVTHGGGRPIAQGSDADVLLRWWTSQGYTRTGAPRDRDVSRDGACSDRASPAPPLASLGASERASYDRFVSDVQPILAASCSSASCHGAPLADLHLACGDDEPQRLWNWWISLQFLGDPVDRSELLRRPLPADRGGTFHIGGGIFTGTDDTQWATIRAWAEATVAADPGRFAERDATRGYRFFVNRVEPVLVRDGCMTLGCHSPIGLRFPLRGGSGGVFSAFARRRNYELARRFLTLEAADPTRSRIIAKNLLDSGVVHRGGALFTPGADVDCDTLDLEHGDLDATPSRCILARWHTLEREDAIARGELPSTPDPRALVWIERPRGLGTPTEFDVHRPGADLRIADVTLDADAHVTLGPSRSLLAGCGFDAATADVRAPAGSWDGTRIAFAARSSAAAPLRLYWVRADGRECGPIPGAAPALDRDHDMLVHDFDPAFAPDGTIVFASNRGDLEHGHPERGATRTAARLEPNANLYVLDPVAGTLRQLTWLLDQELQPSFMGDGHVIYTAEKRARDFHQLALRRHLLDGGDFHPLYASRDSIGFESATEVMELLDGRFAFVGGELDTPDGAGSLVVFDRSIGPDQFDRDPTDRRYFHSLTIALPGPGRGSGAFRSPAPLPTGTILVSCDLRADAVAPYDFDLCELDPRDGSVRVIQATPDRAEIEGMALFARAPRPIARSDGSEIDHPTFEDGARDAIVRFTDFPMIETLMFRNTREGRPIDHRIGGIELFESLPPPSTATSFGSLPAEHVVTDAYGTFYEEHRSIGSAMLLSDGSVRLRVPAAIPISFAPLGLDGGPLDFEAGMPFSGRMIQREAEQYSPGERITRSVPRRFFNSLCGGCHGSISGRELAVGVSLDVLTGASIDLARTAEAVDLTH